MTFVNTRRMARSPTSPIVQELRWAHDTIVRAELADGVAGIQGLGISILPLGFAAVAQAVAVIAGGIDLSIGSMMALTSVIAATLMDGQSAEFGLATAVGVLVLGLVLGGINGALVVVTRVPDIVVTLAMSFVWAGFALLVRAAPGGAARTSRAK